MNRSTLRIAAYLCLLALFISAGGFVRLLPPTHAQVRARYDLGAAGLGQLLRRLQTTASALHTGAHPDDEDTALIARLARGDQARVAYLSLNRGEGGQNIIGPELFEPLGVIRTEELLQSRRLDGGEQLFTRAFDYGFSKARTEAAQKWGEQQILGDMVRAIRLYRPLVIISRFSGTPADGHGQHQLAGYLTPIAFKAAADPNQFPEQIAQGLRPWQALKLYVGESFVSNKTNVPSFRVETGRPDPLIGRTYYEIAAEGRSQHKSQEMGMIELQGPQSSGVRLLESINKATAEDKSIFDGIDTSIKGIAAIAKLQGGIIDSELDQIQGAAARALAEYQPLAPEKLIPTLADGLKATRAARRKVASLDSSDSSRSTADFLLAEKEQEFSAALQSAASVTVDALSNVETLVPGASLTVTARVFIPNESLAKVSGVEIKTPEGWQTSTATAPEQSRDPYARFFKENAQVTSFFKVTAPESAPYTQPYWLAHARNNYLFDWTDPSTMNLPFAPPLLNADAQVEIGGVPVSITKQVQYRYRDDIRGEIRREVNVVPAISLSYASDLTIVPLSKSAQTRRIAVRVANNADNAMAGEVSLNLPAGWKSDPATTPFAFTKKDQHTAAIFTVSIPAGSTTGAHGISAKAVVGGKTYDQQMHVIAYPHIQTHRTYTPAIATVRVLDLKTADVNVGYIMGSGDQVPEAIKQMGLKVSMLDENELSSGDLSKYDTIVVGVRASEVRPDYVANNARLLDFVKNGGTLIVQYQRPDYVQLGLAPFPAQMASRVTDENAKVTVLQPQHPAFNSPNRITDDDWRNWVQERDLYGFTTFDPRYTALLESHDAGEGPQNGGEVYAEIGKGKYIYSSYAWFRQLPAGVPGAYRLFANLLSLPKAGNANAKVNSTKKPRE